MPARFRSKDEKKRKKALLYERQKGRCFYCSNDFTILQLTFDHVQRKRDGGSNHISNLVLACLFCNQYRELEHASEEARRKFLKRHIHFIHTGRQ